MAITPVIWTTRRPAEWAQAPEWMSFHFLTEAERCPRAASLRYSSYPELWNTSGYPRKPHIGALSGHIVHVAVARLVRELASRGCRSLQEVKAIETLKDIGGYSKIITQTTDAVLAGLADNPRFDAVRDHISSRLRWRLVQMREQVQVLLSRLSWLAKTEPPGGDCDKPEIPLRGGAAVIRKPLSYGAHFEVELRDEVLRWKGIADLLELSDDECTITDFKTGDTSDIHHLQLRIYALLWVRDTALNPSARPATRLILSYPHDEHLVACLGDLAEENTLADELESRTTAVRQSLQFSEPKANVSEENCRGCEVRHLCDEYWTAARHGWGSTRTSAKQAHFEDVEVVLKQKRTDATWEAESGSSSVIPACSNVLVRLPAIAGDLDQPLRSGTRIRFTDALVSIVEHGEIPLINAIASTELLIVTDDTQGS